MRLSDIALVPFTRPAPTCTAWATDPYSTFRCSLPAGHPEGHEDRLSEAPCIVGWTDASLGARPAGTPYTPPALAPMLPVHPDGMTAPTTMPTPGMWAVLTDGSQYEVVAADADGITVQSVDWDDEPDEEPTGGLLWDEWSAVAWLGAYDDVEAALEALEALNP